LAKYVTSGAKASLPQGVRDFSLYEKVISGVSENFTLSRNVCSYPLILPIFNNHFDFGIAHAFLSDEYDMIDRQRRL